MKQPVVVVERRDDAVIVEPMRARDHPAEQWDALFAGGWPAFIDADVTAAAALPTVRDVFADWEIAVLRDEVLVAAGWGVPIRWSGAPDDLPTGYSDALARAVADHEADVEADTLVICAAQVRPDQSGSGLSRRLLAALIDTAIQRGISAVIAPLRPTGKHRYPLIPIEAYAGWTRPDGTAFDPWLRTHLRMGATMITTSPCSQVFTGSVAQWEAWSGLELPESGAYIVPQALAPLVVDRTADLGTCTEPAIWVRHR